MTDNSIPQDTPDFSRRYWLFSWWGGYGGSLLGGMDDFVGSFDTIEDAVSRVTSEIYPHNEGMIFDVDNRKNVAILNEKWTILE